MESFKIIEIISNNGGELLSDIKDNIKYNEKVLIKCKFNHTFSKNYYKLKNGEWCPSCNKKGKINIDELRYFASLKEGKCLSNTVKNCKDKILWECKFGHKWYAIYDSIIYRNIWCPKCAGNAKLSIDDMKVLAKNKNGDCLSDIYNGVNNKLLWKCSENHIWSATPNNIKKNKWCPKCAGNAKLSINDLQQIAFNFGGKLISNIYYNSGQKIEWECKNNHKFKLSPNNIVSKNMWCPECSNKFLSEEICRLLFEKIFDEKFPKCFPVWLKNHNTGYLLQLDGFCEKLKIAFEHQGEQHYEMIGKFFKTNKEFEDLKKRDRLKIKLCKKYNIKLFIIPSLFYRTKLEDLCSLIENQSKVFNLQLNLSNIDIKEIYYNVWKK